VVWSSTSFTYTHQKTITVNNDESYVSTGNFDTTYYATSRDFGVFDTDASDVAAIVAVFNADYAHTSITPSDGDDLVWSPTDSQSQLLALVNGATRSLDVEQEEFSDTTLVNAIVADENRGVTVRVVVEDPSDYTSELNKITAAGGKVTGYSSSTGFYIHGKTVIADYGTSTAKAFAGSENFSSNSLNNNRELGMITTDSGVVSGLESTFSADFTGSSTGKVAIFSPGTQTTAVGAAVSLQIQGEDTATGALSYAATGLPAGLSISSSTGVISGTTTKAGTSSVTVTGTDSTGASGSATFTWTVNSGSAGGCGAQQLIQNGGFQSGSLSPWSASSGVLTSASTTHPSYPTSDAYLAWLDGYSGKHTDTLSQTVTIPATCATATLSFWLYIDSNAATASASDTFTTQVLNSSGTVLATLSTLSNQNAGTGYAAHSFSLASFIGQTITIKFTGTETLGGGDDTSFFEDDNALNAD
jgi:hypothetical protein